MSKKHEYLKRKDFYETKHVGTRAKRDKDCDHCGEIIPKGEPHDVHHFYPEFFSYPTHKSCSEPFKESLL